MLKKYGYSTMICITDVEYIETKGDIHRIYEASPYNPVIGRMKSTNPNGSVSTVPIEDEIKYEIIRSTRIINANGEEIRLGMSKRAQDLIGLPFDLLESQNRELSELRRTIDRYIVVSKHKDQVIENLQKEIAKLKGNKPETKHHKNEVRIIKI